MNAMLEKLQQRVSDRDAALEVSTYCGQCFKSFLRLGLCVNISPKGDHIFCMLFTAHPLRGVPLAGELQSSTLRGVLAAEPHTPF